MMVGLKWISAALGLATLTASAALAQNVVSPNQLTANRVADSLRTSKALSGHRIEIEAQGGQVTLSGVLASPAQKAEAIARARSVAGVAGVADRLVLSGGTGVHQAQYEPQVALGHGGFGHGGGAAYGGGEVMNNVAGGGSAMGGQVTSTPVGADGGPVPEGPAGNIGGLQAATANRPNYAWPSYAPYPNFSAVGYPTAYPWQAWPNIGPPSPYPEVPLDWRAVTLRWDDGIWWLDFKKHYTRPFFTPYPFGLFAY